jgi:hypothetical protein
MCVLNRTQTHTHTHRPKLTLFFIMTYHNKKYNTPPLTICQRLRTHLKKPQMQSVSTCVLNHAQTHRCTDTHKHPFNDLPTNENTSQKTENAKCFNMCSQSRTNTQTHRRTDAQTPRHTQTRTNTQMHKHPDTPRHTQTHPFNDLPTIENTSQKTAKGWCFNDLPTIENTS